MILLKLGGLSVDFLVRPQWLIYQQATIWSTTFTETSKVFAKTFAMDCIALLDLICANKFVRIHLMQLTDFLLFLLFRLLILNADVQIVVPVLFLYS